MSHIEKLSIIAQGESGDTIRNITGDECARCSCYNYTLGSYPDLRNFTADSNCVKAWVNTLSKLLEGTNEKISGFNQLIRDPWDKSIFV